MQRLAKFDVSRRFARPEIQLAAQLAFGIACAGAMILLLTIISLWVRQPGPFALVYPTVLIATLYGRWRAGLIASVLSFVWTWYYILPLSGTFAFAAPSDAHRVALNAVSSLIVLVLAESFRRAVTTAVEERDGEIGRRTLLMRELDHRTKNNFALVVSLLELQKRRESDPQVGKALDLATSRIHSFARAYANLAESQGEGESVRMKPYIDEVVQRFSGGAFHDGIEVFVEAANCVLPREIAVAIGLFTNEALTNCAKYAFPDGRSGRVEVRLAGDAEKWELVIEDDGVGNGDRTGTGLGTTLLKAFAQQAQAEYELEAASTGRRLRLVSN